MKKLFLLIIIFVLLVGCAQDEKIPLTAVDEAYEEIVLDFVIEQIVLSKGFQSTDSNVEVIKEGGNTKLLITAGLIESSGINIDKITKEGRDVNIYLRRLMEQNNIQLAVPQITLKIEKPIIKDAEELKFNIIAEDYEPISLKFNRNQILEKIYMEHKIETSNMPKVELIKHKENILWNIHFTNLLDKENSKSPLFDLHVKADAITGEILDTERHSISTYIDDGQLLDYISDDFLLYKKQYTENEITYESLWIYDIDSTDRSKLYTTKYRIQSALFSPDGKYISLIDVDDAKSDIYIIETEKNIAYKITPIDFLHPKLMKWENDNQLCFIDIYNNNSIVFMYDVRENILNRKLTLNRTIESFDILNEKFVFAETDELNINKNIYLIENGVDLEQIGSGFKPSFYDDNNIIYLQNKEEENANILIEYSTEKNSLMNKLNKNIVNYYKLDDENLLYIEKTNSNNEYSLSKYNVYNKTGEFLFKANSDIVFYSSNEKKAYISLTIPSKEKSITNIYCIDLSELNICCN